MTSAHRAGFIAVVGRPNVGKSTLINAIVGRKISIVTPKPQTTRHRILAVHTTADYQAIFVDTPGIHRKSAKAMNRMMNRTAVAALADADLVLYVTDSTRYTDEDGDVLKRLDTTRAPVIAVLNKIDLVHPKEKLLETIGTMASRRDFEEIVPLSAKREKNLDALLTLITQYLPESPPLFPEDMRSDRSDDFHAAEVIREKLTILLRDELPYGVTVQIEKYARDSDGLDIAAVIWVERDSQKGIVVGKGGQMLKQVGRSARLDLKSILGVPVHLELWVKVKDNWADSEKDLATLGYDTP
jgi:GTP-binding protein Era